jgi:hypothetical protein
MNQHIHRICLAAALVFVTSGTGQAQETPVSTKDWLKNNLIISYWCGPPSARTEEPLYRDIKDGGFNAAMPYHDGNKLTDYTKEKNLKYLDKCQEVGIKALVADPRIWEMVRDKEKYPGPIGPYLDAAIADYASHPALLGYIVDDEPGASLFPRIAETVDYLRQKDPTHITYINLLPTYASVHQQLQTATYQEYVEKFLATVKCDLSGYDNYNGFKQWNGEGSDKEKGLPPGPDFYNNLEIFRPIAAKHHQTWAVCIHPDANDTRLRVMACLAYGARGIFYFTYWNAWPAFLVKDGARTPEYEEAKKLNREIGALSKVLLGLECEAVYHAGEITGSCQPLPSGESIPKVEGGNAIVSLFKDAEGGRYLMVVNKDHAKAQTLTVTFDSPVKLAEVSHKDGTFKKLDQASVFSLSFEGGDGRLFKIIK